MVAACPCGCVYYHPHEQERGWCNYCEHTRRIQTSQSAHGHGLYWPAGLNELHPSERVRALERGYWEDGDNLIHRDGRVETAA